MAREGEGVITGSDLNPLPSVERALGVISRHHNSMPWSRCPSEGPASPPPAPACSPIPRGNPGLAGVNINISGPLGLQSRPDSGDIPTCMRSLLKSRVDQKDRLQVAAVHRCPGQIAPRGEGPENPVTNSSRCLPWLQWAFPEVGPRTRPEIPGLLAAGHAGEASPCTHGKLQS